MLGGRFARQAFRGSQEWHPASIHLSIVRRDRDSETD
jgi:hypothetical protein